MNKHFTDLTTTALWETYIVEYESKMSDIIAQIDAVYKRYHEKMNVALTEDVKNKLAILISGKKV